MTDQNFRAGYILEGARRSRYNANHWFRYLRKIITDQGILLSKEETDMILNSSVLTMFQKVTMKRALESGTPTNKRIIALNQKTTTPMIKELLRRRGRV